MTKELLLKKIEEIDKEIDSIIYEGRTAIKDGIIDIDNYLASDLKIMWILKEVNSPDDENWDMRDVLKNLKSECGSKVKTGWANTFNSIIYTTYGILYRKFKEDIPRTDEDPQIIDVLKNIAFVNVKKVSGGAKANYNKLHDFHKKHGEILKNQIEVFNPDVIICGNILEIIDDFGNEYINVKENGMVFYLSPKHIIIDAYHPNNSKVSHKDYCNTIVKQVLEWKAKFKK